MFSRLREQRLSIRWKLLLPFLLIGVLVVTVLLPSTNLLVQSRIEEEADNRLAETTEAVVALLERSEEQALLSATFIANLPQIRAADGMSNTFGELLLRQREELGLQEVSFYSVDFTPGDRPEFYGGPITTQRFQASQTIAEIEGELIAEALSGDVPVSGVALAAQGGRIIGIAPVTGIVDELEGVILTSLFIDDAYIAEVSDILGVDIALIAENASVASTIQAETGYEQLIQSGFIDPGGAISTTNINFQADNGELVRQRLLAGPVEIDDRVQGSILVAQRAGAIEQLQNDIQLALGVFATVVVVASLIFGAIVVWSLARPLRDLATAADRVSRGKLDERVEPQYFMHDEVSDLSTSFNFMTERLEELYHNLEDQVEERTSELVAERNKLQQTMGELAIARDQALESSRTKSAFLATMSHELRTPLNSVIGYSQMLHNGLTGDMTEKQLDYIERVLRNGRHLLLLINDLLDLAKIEAGRVEIVHGPMQVREWTNEIVLQTRGLADDKGVEFQLDYDANMPQTVIGDPDRIKQIVINLLSNAIKFTHEGHVKLGVRAANATHWEITVEDTGIGIPPHALEYIFDEFRQVDDSSSREFSGTGLGLAIVRNLSLLMDGNVRVTSKVGQGTTFIVTLPLVQEAAVIS